VRLLLDAAFPTAAEGLSRPGWTVERWSGGEISDIELVETADREGFTGLAFVGPAALARQDVLELAASRHLLLIVTSADDPFKAQRDLLEHLANIVKHPNRGPVVLVSSRGPSWRQGHPL
jgi:hypothetical protein